jgi:hypothetical protein
MTSLLLIINAIQQLIAQFWIFIAIFALYGLFETWMHWRKNKRYGKKYIDNIRH